MNAAPAQEGKLREKAKPADCEQRSRDRTRQHLRHGMVPAVHTPDRRASSEGEETKEKEESVHVCLVMVEVR